MHQTRNVEAARSNVRRAWAAGYVITTHKHARARANMRSREHWSPDRRKTSNLLQQFNSPTLQLPTSIHAQANPRNHGPPASTRIRPSNQLCLIKLNRTDPKQLEPPVPKSFAPLATVFRESSARSERPKGPRHRSGLMYRYEAEWRLLVWQCVSRAGSRRQVGWWVVGERAARRGCRCTRARPRRRGRGPRQEDLLQSPPS